MGELVGLGVGLPGRKVGIEVGKFDGVEVKVGRYEGEFVGIDDGMVVGSRVGTLVGVDEGTGVGEPGERDDAN